MSSFDGQGTKRNMRNGECACCPSDIHQGVPSVTPSLCEAHFLTVMPPETSSFCYYRGSSAKVRSEEENCSKLSPPKLNARMATTFGAVMFQHENVPFFSSARPQVMVFVIVLFLHMTVMTDARDDGLARTPPMGWLSWTRFMCERDCLKRPDGCISEGLFKTMADKLVAEGYAAAGYVQVNVDDCWAEMERSPEGALVPDRERFPGGVESLADYMHSRGLRLGMYSNYGQVTCMGHQPGSTPTTFDRDAETFARWRVDMLKLDGCFTEIAGMDEAYQSMGKSLNATGRPMVYSCSWPYYQAMQGKKPNYDLIASSCHLWRNYHDIQINYGSVKAIIQHYDENQDLYARYHGPGHWNDPDMLIVGNPELTSEQARVQMALWCIWSAPLLMSNDLRRVPEAHRQILLNRQLIAVNQDPLGRMGKLVGKKGSLKIYLKPITPTLLMDKTTVYSYAIAVVNDDDQNVKVHKLSLLKDLRLPKHRHGYALTELFSGAQHGLLAMADELVVRLQPSSALLFRAVVYELADLGEAHAALLNYKQPESDKQSYAFIVFALVLMILLFSIRRSVFSMFYRLCKRL